MSYESKASSPSCHGKSERGWSETLASWSISVGLLLSAGAHADDAAASRSSARGRDIALNVCSACHQVASDQPAPQLATVTPSFTQIANRPGIDAKWLQHFVLTTHWDEKTMPIKMPDPMLMPEQAADVARYIMSLRKP